MILVRLMGGLGNQMFQYATALRLAHKNHTSLKLDASVYENMAAIDTPRQYELSVFAIEAELATAQDLARVVPPAQRRSLAQRIKHRLGVGSDIFIYGEAGSSFQPLTLQLPDNTMLVGWWQNEKYFKDIRNTLIAEFTPKVSLSKTSATFLKRIEAIENSISLHVRRGDYVSNPHANVHHGLTPLEYYGAAVEYIRRYTKDPHFFVFSDDITWCKQNLDLGKDATFVIGNDGVQAYEDLILMSHCHHNIVANSSFSWWGAWLNDNSDKVVIAPQVWYQNEQANSETEIVPEDWVRL